MHSLTTRYFLSPLQKKAFLSLSLPFQQLQSLTLQNLNKSREWVWERHNELPPSQHWLFSASDQSEEHVGRTRNKRQNNCLSWRRETWALRAIVFPLFSYLCHALVFHESEVRIISSGEGRTAGRKQLPTEGLGRPFVGRLDGGHVGRGPRSFFAPALSQL